MNRRFRLSIALSLAAALLLSAAHVVSPQIGAQCKCTTEISLIPDQSGGCCCTAIILTNLTVKRAGKCTNNAGACSPPSTLTCKVVGTFSEDSCASGPCTPFYVDEPFTIEKECLPSGDGTASASFQCSVVSPQPVHVILLTCKRCTSQPSQ